MIIVRSQNLIGRAVQRLSDSWYLQITLDTGTRHKSIIIVSQSLSLLGGVRYDSFFREVPNFK